VFTSNNNKKTMLFDDDDMMHHHSMDLQIRQHFQLVAHQTKVLMLQYRLLNLYKDGLVCASDMVKLSKSDIDMGC